MGLGWPRVAALAAVAAATVLSLPSASGAAAPKPSPFFAAPFRVTTNHTFGQSPSFTPGGKVLSNEPDAGKTEQVYVSGLDGSRRRCLTCGRLAGPNGFPQERPQGDWIMFASMGHRQHLGAPGLGGYGGDLYVMRPGGSRVTLLTRASDPAGARYDNYHPFFSPDGRQLIWTRVRAYPLSRGGEKWEMMLADFVAAPGKAPRLGHVRVVGPAFGVYETQPWAPDGSGFLFTAFGPRRSPFEASAPGWMNLELYYIRLYGPGASPAKPRVTHLTDDAPDYEEQAVFTPDMRDVIVMSNRGTRAGWYQSVITAAQAIGYDAPATGSAGGPMFLADFSDTRFRTDLLMIDVRTRAVRRLTHDHRVIPEFFWDRGYRRLLWTETQPGTRALRTRVGRFAGIGTTARRPPVRSPAPGLAGQPIDLSRVRGATTGVAGGSTAGNLPTQIGSYTALLLGQLRTLGERTGTMIASPTFALGPAPKARAVP